MIKQKSDTIPFLASALAMLVGLYLLAGPFRLDRSDLLRLLPSWATLLAYEFLVIGMIAVLHRKGHDTTVLTFISLLFLVDILFLGDAFASTELEAGLRFNLAAWILSLVKAFALCRARQFKPSPWQVGWVAWGLLFIQVFPSAVSFPAAQPADFSGWYWLGVWTAMAICVPLSRYGRVGGAISCGVLVHLLATGVVFSVDFSTLFTPDNLGVLLVVGSFALLILGFQRLISRPSDPPSSEEGSGDSGSRAAKTAVGKSVVPRRR